MRDRIVPIEVKLGGEPRVTRGLVECMKDLRLPRGFVVHGGPASYPLSKVIWALSIRLIEKPFLLRDALLRPSKVVAGTGA
jgi:hypothetical protein